MDIKTVSMITEEPVHEGGPVTADVHPDEVQTFINLGWKIAETASNSTRLESEGDDMGSKPKPKPRGK